MRYTLTTEKNVNTCCLSAVTLGRRVSDKPCDKGTISLDGVGDSCIRQNQNTCSHLVVKSILQSAKRQINDDLTNRSFRSRAAEPENFCLKNQNTEYEYHQTETTRELETNPTINETTDSYTCMDVVIYV